MIKLCSCISKPVIINITGCYGWCHLKARIYIPKAASRVLQAYSYNHMFTTCTCCLQCQVLKFGSQNHYTFAFDGYFYGEMQHNIIITLNVCYKHSFNELLS